jgi:regulator of sigma E protease
MFHGLAMLVRGSASVSGVAGPIGMGQLTSEVLKVSAAPVWITLTNIMVLLSLNLAVLNLLPIPALDGGRLFFVLIESIRGKRVSPEREGVVHFVGLMLLLMFMLVVAFVDIDRLVSGQSLLR